MNVFKIVNMYGFFKNNVPNPSVHANKKYGAINILLLGPFSYLMDWQTQAHSPSNKKKKKKIDSLKILKLSKDKVRLRLMQYSCTAHSSTKEE